MHALITLALLIYTSLFSSALHTPPCTPAIGEIQFGAEQDFVISGRLAQLRSADQAGRQPGEEFDLERMIVEDRERRIEVMEYLLAGQVNRPDDLLHAALIFQHGDCSAHYALAAQLAERAAEQGRSDAYWLYAAAIDRYLLSIGRLQRYGMQYNASPDGQIFLCPIDTQFPDAERQKIGMVTLAEAHEGAAEIYAFNHDGQPLPDLSTEPYGGVQLFIDRLLAWHNCYIF